MLEVQELIEKLNLKGIPKFRALQIMQAVHKEGKKTYEEISTLPENLKTYLRQEIPILSLTPIRTLISKNHETEKVLFLTRDDLKIEAVLMHFRDNRHSVCVSSQVGCQLGCKFCATGKMKFGRNLNYEEIADQVLYFSQKLQENKQRISNIVYMGMGEPFLNYDNVLKSVKVINNTHGLGIGARNITISTSGICEGIEKLANEKIQVNLAVSLHAPNQELREKIMPIAKKYSLEKLMKAIQSYLQHTKRRVSYEYVMLKGINDSTLEANQLVELIKDQLCHINLIPYNATGIEGMKGSDKKNIFAFRNIIKKAGIPITVRVTLGQDIDAACGQLANKA